MSFFVSDKIDLIRPIIDQLGAVAIHRIKANCNLRTEQIKEAGFHTDISESRMIESEPMVATFYTSIVMMDIQFLKMVQRLTV